MVRLQLLDTIKRVAKRDGKPQNHLYVTLSELQQATNNFSEGREIGHGGFGKVYMGVFDNGTMVAVKRRNPKSSQGKEEFHVEIELLSGLEHRNLVKLIGYCDEKKEMILVYEYMENGSLKSHLYGSDKPSLSWKKRLEILVGVAKGLNYLHREHHIHTGSTNAIIHRDVKSENILLDRYLCAKVGDFGISKTGPKLDQNQTHVSTQVKGTWGYLAPEYVRTQHLTDKSDVYSFGVVLLEVLCARPVIEVDKTLPEDEACSSLAEWGMKMIKDGELRKIVDQRISGTIKQHSLELFGKVVEKCLAAEKRARASMEDVVKDLELVLSLEVNHPLTRCAGKKNFSRASGVPADLQGPSTCQVPSPALDEGISTVAAGNSDESDDGISSQPIINPGERRALTRCPRIKLP